MSETVARQVKYFWLQVTNVSTHAEWHFYVTVQLSLEAYGLYERFVWDLKEPPPPPTSTWRKKNYFSSCCAYLLQAPPS